MPAPDLDQRPDHDSNLVVQKAVALDVDQHLAAAAPNADAADRANGALARAALVGEPCEVVSPHQGRRGAVGDEIERVQIRRVEAPEQAAPGSPQAVP